MTKEKQMYLLLSDVTPRRATVVAISADRDELRDMASGEEITAELEGEIVPEVGKRIHWGYVAWVVSV